jgi:hypothetical protein
MKTNSRTNRNDGGHLPASRRVSSGLQLEGLLGFVAEQVRFLAGEQTRTAPAAKRKRQQREADRQDRARDPLLHRHVLHQDADVVHLAHVLEAADGDDHA